MTKMICIAGFGDHGGMFEPLASTALSRKIECLPFNMPGFGAPPLATGRTSLASLASVVDEEARACGGAIILAHSVASIIASLAVLRDGSPITAVLSLEGNLTAGDAYFSGMAAQYETPDAFRAGFLEKLDERARRDPAIGRYRSIVETADPQALWELGRDAHRFSSANAPGEVLLQSGKAAYLYNPANTPRASLDWLDEHDLFRIEMPNASHWASVDQPDLLAEKIVEALARLGSTI